MIRLGLVFALGFLIDANAHVKENTPGTSLPVDTVFKLRANLNILPNVAKTALLIDKDEDGVSDNQDYCPKTPAGRSVHHPDDLIEKEKTWAGCSGQADDVSVTAPESSNLKCNLEMEASPHDREVKKTLELTLTKVTKVKPDENYNPLHLTVKTPKGGKLEFYCGNDNGVNYYRTVPTLGQLESAFSITLPSSQDIE